MSSIIYHPHRGYLSTTGQTLNESFRAHSEIGRGAIADYHLRIPGTACVGCFESERHHATLHWIVEAMLAFPGAEHESDVVRRFRSFGVDRHNLIHAIARVLQDPFLAQLRSEDTADPLSVLEHPDVIAGLSALTPVGCLFPDASPGAPLEWEHAPVIGEEREGYAELEEPPRMRSVWLPYPIDVWQRNVRIVFEWWTRSAAQPCAWIGRLIVLMLAHEMHPLRLNTAELTVLLDDLIPAHLSAPPAAATSLLFELETFYRFAHEVIGVETAPAVLDALRQPGRTERLADRLGHESVVDIVLDFAMVMVDETDGLRFRLGLLNEAMYGYQMSVGSGSEAEVEASVQRYLGLDQGPACAVDEPGTMRRIVGRLTRRGRRGGGQMPSRRRRKLRASRTRAK